MQARQPVAPVRDAVEALLRTQTAGLRGEVSIETGRIDANNQLPACQHLEAFLPAGARAWGAVTVGVRCSAPAQWSLYVPSRVRVVADYLVVARRSARAPDARPGEHRARAGDVAALPGDVLTDAVQAVGHPAATR